MALVHILNSTEYQLEWRLSDGFQSGTGTLKNIPTYQPQNKKGEDQQKWTWSQSLYFRSTGNSVALSRLGSKGSEGSDFLVSGNSHGLKTVYPAWNITVTLLLHLPPILGGCHQKAFSPNHSTLSDPELKLVFQLVLSLTLFLPSPKTLSAFLKVHLQPILRAAKHIYSSSGISPTCECVGFVTSCYNPQKWVYPHNVRNETQKHPRRRWRSKLVADYQILQRLQFWNIQGNQSPLCFNRGREIWDYNSGNPMLHSLSGNHSAILGKANFMLERTAEFFCDTE